ncbi:hypothetical protein ONV78_16165 [Hahella sp. CR1]|nr:hypothetical protein [Hahella sp. CR1]MDG9669278.1 hypothetical protein [Hahella sp. CR1]
MQTTNDNPPVRPKPAEGHPERLPDYRPKPIEGHLEDYSTR